MKKKPKKAPAVKPHLNGKPHSDGKKTPAKTPGAGELVPMAHGGAIRNGSQPGNPPGTGRPPSAIREAMRKHLDLEVLGDVIAKRKTGELDTLDVAEFLAKYGLGTMKEVTVENVRERLRLTLEVLRRELTPPQLRIIIPQIEGVWKG